MADGEVADGEVADGEVADGSRGVAGPAWTALRVKWETGWIGDTGASV